MGRPFQATTFPALRSLANKWSSLTGKFRSKRIFIISRPTEPVAPRIPTLYCFISQSSPIEFYFAKLS